MKLPCQHPAKPAVPAGGLRGEVPQSSVEKVQLYVGHWGWILCAASAVSTILTLLSYAIGSQAMSMKSSAMINPANATTGGFDPGPVSGFQVGHFILMLMNQWLPLFKAVLAQDGLYWPKPDSSKSQAWFYTGSAAVMAFVVNAALCWTHCSSNGQGYRGYLIATWMLQIVNQAPLSSRPSLVFCHNTNTAVIVPDNHNSVSSDNSAYALTDADEALPPTKPAQEANPSSRAAARLSRHCPSEFSGVLALRKGPTVLAYREGVVNPPEDRIVTRGEYITIAVVVVAHLIAAGAMYAICDQLSETTDMGAMNHWAAWGALTVSAFPAARRSLELSKQRTARTSIAGVSQLAFSFVAMMLCCMAPSAFVGVFLSAANNAGHTALPTAVKRSDEWFEYHANREMSVIAHQRDTTPGRPSLANAISKFFKGSSVKQVGGRRASLLDGDHLGGSGEAGYAEENEGFARLTEDSTDEFGLL